jgi:predicted O-methyltransferase YrrM
MVITLIVPKIVEEAYERAQKANYKIFSEREFGRLLATLSAIVPKGGRILEIGTGVGVGTAWISSSISNNSKIELITIEKKIERARYALEYPWPPFVEIIVNDFSNVSNSIGEFDLIFADAAAGKWYDLNKTIDILKPNGILIVDDMLPPFANENEEKNKLRVRKELINHPLLISCELDFSSGIIISTKVGFEIKE